MIFPSFWFTPFFLSVIAVSKRTNDETTKSFSIIQYSGIIAAIVAIIFVWTQKDIKKTYVKWFEAQQLYQNRR